MTGKASVLFLPVAVSCDANIRKGANIVILILTRVGTLLLVVILRQHIQLVFKPLLEVTEEIML